MKVKYNLKIDENQFTFKSYFHFHVTAYRMYCSEEASQVNCELQMELFLLCFSMGRKNGSL